MSSLNKVLYFDTELDSIVYQWSGMPRDLVIPAPEKISRWARIKERYRLMFFYHGRCWDSTLKFVAQGSFTKAVFRRRTQQERNKLHWLIFYTMHLQDWIKWLVDTTRGVRRILGILTSITLDLICVFQV
jgi:hypothetical protein